MHENKHRELIMETKTLVIKDNVIQLRRIRGNKLLGEMAGGYAHSHTDAYTDTDIGVAIAASLNSRAQMLIAQVQHIQTLMLEHDIFNTGYSMLIIEDKNAPPAEMPQGAEGPW